MATYYDGQDLSATTAVSFAAKSYYFIAIDSTGKMALPTAIGQRVHGINLDNAASGLIGTYRAYGSSKLTLGATVDEGELVMSDANGKGIVATDGGGAAVALSSGVSGDVIQVLLIPSLASGNGYLSAAGQVWTHKLDLAAMAATGTPVNLMIPGVRGKIKKVYWITDTPGTGTSAALTLTWKIGATATTGGLVSLTLATTTPSGLLINGTAVTAANSFVETDTLTLASTVTTAFSTGTGTLYTVIGQ